MDWTARAAWSWDDEPRALHVFVVTDVSEAQRVCRRYSWTCAFSPGVVMDVALRGGNSRRAQERAQERAQVVFVTSETARTLSLPAGTAALHVYMTRPHYATWAALTDALYRPRRSGVAPLPATLYVHGPRHAAWARRVVAEQAVLDRVRDIQNQPANRATPELMAQHVALWFANVPGVTVETLHHDDIRREGLLLIDAVGKGASAPPALVIVRYTPQRTKSTEPVDTIVLVGKGITFDTGGYSMKPKSVISGMHTDKSGASVALGLVYAAARQRYRRPLVALLPFATNAVSDRATLPHDVVRSYAGLDVEITDTDAEGRLVLADALAYIPRVVPVSRVHRIVDMATLTGLGDRIHSSLAAGVFTHDDAAATELERLGIATGDYVWRIPHWPEGEASLESPIADVLNVGSGPEWRDTFMAGVFLHRFVPASLKKKWIHVDIANNWSKRIARGKSWRLLWHWLLANEK